MASSPQDPQVGHSLWLQRRFGRLGVREVCWRSDWTPVGLVVLLLGLLLLLSLFWPRHEVVDRVEQAAQDGAVVGIEHPPVIGVLAEP